jgi:hypothetical protein
MLHDGPKGIDVDHALWLLAALEYHALPGLLHLLQRPLTYDTAFLDIFHLPLL